MLSLKKNTILYIRSSLHDEIFDKSYSFKLITCYDDKRDVLLDTDQQFVRLASLDDDIELFETYHDNAMNFIHQRLSSNIFINFNDVSRFLNLYNDIITNMLNDSSSLFILNIIEYLLYENYIKEYKQFNLNEFLYVYTAKKLIDIKININNNVLNEFFSAFQNMSSNIIFSSSQIENFQTIINIILSLFPKVYEQNHSLHDKFITYFQQKLQEHKIQGFVSNSKFGNCIQFNSNKYISDILLLKINSN